jgi:acetyl esterase
MSREPSNSTKIISYPALLRIVVLTLAFTLLLVVTLSGLAQVGNDSEYVKNLPGYSKPPTGPPRPVPKESTDPQVKAVLSQIAAAGFLDPQTPEQARKAYLFYTKLGGPPENVFHVENLEVPGPASNIPIRVYFPRSGQGFPMFVFFHGGGFVGGSIDSHDVALRAVTNRCGCVVVSVAYRLAPESQYPAATDDAYAATKWVADHAAEIHGDPQLIAVGGDGAGGNIAVEVALMARDRGGPRLAYEVLIYPILNAMLTSYSWVVSADPSLSSGAMITKWNNYVPFNVSLEDPHVSPIDSATLRNLPPALFITSENDPVRDDIDQFAENLKAAGVPEQVTVYPNAIHGFFLMAAALDAGKKAIDETALTLRAAFNSAT